MVIVHLFLVAAIAAICIFLSVLVAAWALRSFPRRWRKFVRLMSKQLAALSDARIWTTVFLQISAAGCFVAALSSSLAIMWLVLVHIGYVFFVSALTLSLLAAMPVVRSLWGDVFFKSAVFVAPVVMLFIAKGHAALWVGEQFGVSAANLPMTHTLATCFLLLVVVAVVLSAAALLFECLLLYATQKPPSARVAPGSRSFLALSTSTRVVRRKADRDRLHGVSRFLGIVLLTGISFAACYFGFNAVVSLVGNRVAAAALAATAFDFDAGPATQCELSDAERLLASASEPMLKALFLASAQEKALLVRRDKGLFDPIMMGKPHPDWEERVKLTPIRVVECYKAR